jgi:H+-transporting ATPase
VRRRRAHEWPVLIPRLGIPQPPKDFFTAVPFAAERYVDVYLAQRYCGPVFASGVPAATASIMAVTEGPVTNSALKVRRSRPDTSSSLKVGAAEDPSRQVEAQTSPSMRGAAPANGPEVITKRGLTTDEARSRLAKSGPNAMPDTSAHPIRMALDKFWAPVPWMLEAAIVVELALGKYVEAGIIALLLVFNAALGLFQESRAQATLAALKSRLALTASVQRDGAWKTVPATEVVPGDVVKLSLGAVVAADVKLTGGEVLLDQSMLTGESVPIEAGAGVQTYAGALVRRGEAEAEVTATGARTKFGRTAELVRTAHVVSTQQKAVLRVVRNLAAFNGVVIVLLVAYAWYIKMPSLTSYPLS